MTRNIRILPVVLAGALAASTMAPSGASAQLQFTADEYPAHLDGRDTAGEAQVVHSFTAFGIALLSCSGATSGYSATLSEASGTLTVSPTYINCTAAGGALRPTLTLNGCHYEFAVDEEVSEDRYSGTAMLACPASSQVTIRYYSPLDVTHTTVLCQVHIGEQDLGAVKYTVETDGGSTDSLKIEGADEGTIKGIDVTRTAGLIEACSEVTSESAEYHLSVTFTGTNEAEEHNGLRIVE